MQMSRAVEHGVRSLQYLSQRDGVCHVDEVSEKMGIPLAFLRKILQRLVAARIVRSHRGVAGGFSLARRPEDINLLQIVQAVDGEFFLNPCLKGDSDCILDHNCSLQRAWMAGQTALKKTLESYTLRALTTTEVPTAIS